MGLDMYLEKETYIGANFEHRGVEGEITLTRKVKEGTLPIPINPKRVSRIVERVGYWRKANAIHQWFVDNCGGGVDECQRMYVNRENLERLLSTVEHVLSHIEDAKELLPTQPGFFFGGTDYDEWYMQDLEDTRDILNQVLKEDSSWVDFYYRASW